MTKRYSPNVPAQILWDSLQELQCNSVIFKMHTEAEKEIPDIKLRKDSIAVKLYHARVNYLYQYFDQLITPSTFYPHLFFPSTFMRTVFYKNTRDVIRKVVMLHPQFEESIYHDTQFCDLRGQHFNDLAEKYHNNEILRAFPEAINIPLDIDGQRKEWNRAKSLLWEPVRRGKCTFSDSSEPPLITPPPAAYPSAPAVNVQRDVPTIR